MAQTQASLVAARARSPLNYAPFGLLYAIYGGVAGIAIPIFAGKPALAGAAFALLNLGVAAGAFVWGSLNHRLRGNILLALALAGSALTFVALALPQAPLFLIATALFGFFSAASLTLGTLFVMSWHARPDWDEQIGVVQTWMGGGQTLGLIVVGLVLRPLSLTLLGAGVLIVAAAWAATLPAVPASATVPQAHPARHSAFPEAAGMMHVFYLAFHRENWRLLRQSALVRFFVQWGIAMIGAAPIFAFYPLVMRARFDLAPSISAWGFAGATALGIVLYHLAGVWSGKLGTGTVLFTGYVIRGAALAIIAVAIASHAAGFWGIVGFALVVLSWPLLSVAANARVAELAPADAAGSEVGAFYATTMLATVAGSLVGGTLVSAIGYLPVIIASAALLGLAASWAEVERRGSHSKPL